MRIVTCPSSINIQITTSTCWDKNLNSTLTSLFLLKNSIIKINLNLHSNTSTTSSTLVSTNPIPHSTRPSKPVSSTTYKLLLNSKLLTNLPLIMNLQSSYSDFVSNTMKCLQSTMTRRSLPKNRRSSQKTLRSKLNKLTQSKISEKVK